MRSSNLGVIENLTAQFSKEETLELFQKICLIRAFELETKEAYDAGFIKMPVYLSLGQEAVAAALSLSYKNPYIFGQHRCHDLYLAYGGNMQALIDELLHKPTGCARGMGGSASIHDQAINMFGHDGLMGTQIPIAVGFALAKGKRVIAIMGDASAEEDYVLGAMAYAAHKKLPILFVCLDNGLSILTKVEVRRNWRMADVAASFGMRGVEITDDPWLIMHHAHHMSQSLPAFMNVHVVRHLWHAGTGKDSEPEWDRYELVKKELFNLGLDKEAETIRQNAENLVHELWSKSI